MGLHSIEKLKYIYKIHLELFQGSREQKEFSEDPV